MNFNLGDFVRFVDEKREGYITKIFSDEMIGVTGDDDFEIPVPVNKVTRVHGHVYDGSSNQAFIDKPIVAEEFKSTGVYLAVVSDPAKGSVVYFHLVNETSYQLLASLSTEKDKNVKGVFAGIIAARSSVKVFSASLTELNAWPKFYLQVLFYSTLETTKKEPLTYSVKFAAKNFSGEKKMVALLKQQAWSFQVDEKELVIDAQKLKESFYNKPVEEKKEVEKPAKEIDLHIEKLRDDYQFLSKSEILRIQIETFNKSLDAAIVHKLPSIIFIHGVGNGTLKYEIEKVLSKHKQVKTFLDAYKEKFGYGATEIILK